MQLDSRPTIDSRLVWQRRALLLSFPLFTWGLILVFALITSSPQVKKNGPRSANLNLQFTQDRCTFLNWKSKEFAKTGQPSLRIDAQRAMTQYIQGGGYKEKLYKMRLAFCPSSPSTLLLADCARASYTFSTHYLTAQEIQWRLLPARSQSLLNSLFSSTLSPPQLSFGECRDLKVQFQLPKPRFEAIGFSAHTPLAAKSLLP